VHPISGKERRTHGGGTAASQRARFQALCVASSWFRQNSVVSFRITSVDWASYPIRTLSEVPEMDARTSRRRLRATPYAGTIAKSQLEV
jgi:hypothetical protein